MNFLKSLRYVPVKLYNPETVSYRDRVLANGGIISEGSLDAIEKFVQDCKNAHIWDKFLDVGPFAGSNLNAALVKLVHPAGVPGVLTNLNFVSGDFAERGPDGGLLGDGATKYLNTGFNAPTHLPDNSHLSFYLRQDVSATGNRSMLGTVDGGDQYWIGALTPSAAVDARLGQTVTATLASPFGKGFYIGSRTASNQLKLYKNGQMVASATGSTTHNKPAANLYLFAFNSVGTTAAFLPSRGSFYSIGHGLNDTEALALHHAVRTLQGNLAREIA